MNFDTFTNLFHKKYDSEERKNRALLNFLFNQRDITEHNEKYEEGLVSFTRAPCEYSDMTEDEVNTLVNGFTKPSYEDSEGDFTLDEDDSLVGEYEDENLNEEIVDYHVEDDQEIIDEVDQLDENYIAEYDQKRRKRQINNRRVKRQSTEDPRTLDYVVEGYLNDIQDQGVCGSCWR